MILYQSVVFIKPGKLKEAEDAELIFFLIWTEGLPAELLALKTTKYPLFVLFGSIAKPKPERPVAVLIFI